MKLQYVRRAVLPALIVVAFAGLTACASDSDETTRSATSEQAALEVKTASALVESMSTAPALSGGEPVQVESGKTLGILSCGTAATACRDIAAEATKAAEALGWTATTVDGEVNAQGYATGMSRLVAEHPDAIISVAAPDSATAAAHAEAAQAGIPVVCIFCGNKLADPVADPSAANVEVDYAAQAKANAAYMIAHSNGAARVAVLNFDLSGADKVRQDSFRSSIAADCTDCEVVDSVDVPPGADLVAATRQASTALLSRYGKGELDYILTPADSFSPGAVQAVKLAGRDDVKVVGYDCDPSALDAIRDDSIQVACADTPLLESGWASVDVVARLLAGQEPEDVTLPFSLVMGENVPAPGDTATTFDYETYFSELWGL